jgi:hypothetical protein
MATLRERERGLRTTPVKNEVGSVVNLGDMGDKKASRPMANILVFNNIPDFNG